MSQPTNTNSLYPFSLTEGVLCFPEDFGPSIMDRFQSALWAIDRNEFIKKVVFDFSGCVRTFPNTMLPTIAGASWLRDANIQVDYVPPRHERTARLFRDTNWSHYLDTRQFDRSDGYTDQHLSVLQYRDSAQQHTAVKTTIDLVIRSTTISKSALNALEWCLNEVTDNVLNHSDAPNGGWLQLGIMPERIAICVADTGRGLLKSLNPRYRQLRTDLEAIEYSLRPGTTRDPDVGQGNGLKGSLRLAFAFDGRFAIRSYQGEILWVPDAQLYRAESSDPFPGTIVDIQMRHDKDVDIASAISGDANSQYQPTDVLEEKYLQDDLQTLRIMLADETNGVGNRQAGSQMRTKLHNIMTAHPHSPIVLDWFGIQILASSFADEFVGKLFVELGPLEFMARIRLVRLEPLVRQIVEKAIKDRAFQSQQRRDPRTE